MRLELNNLQTKPIFAFAFIFLGCTHQGKHKMIIFFVQFEKYIRPNI